MSGAGRLVRKVVLIAMPLLAACATGAPREGSGSPRVNTVLEVQNNLLPPRGVTIRVISAGGPRTVLGVVPTGRTVEFEYEQPGFQGIYYFVAEIDGGASVRSSNVTLRDGTKWEWTLQTNVLRTVD